MLTQGQVELILGVNKAQDLLGKIKQELYYYGNDAREILALVVEEVCIASKDSDNSSEEGIFVELVAESIIDKSFTLKDDSFSITFGTISELVEQVENTVVQDNSGEVAILFEDEESGFYGYADRVDLRCGSYEPIINGLDDSAKRQLGSYIIEESCASYQQVVKLQQCEVTAITPSEVQIKLL